MTINHPPNTEIILDYTLPVIDVIALVIALVVFVIQLFIVTHVHEINRSVKANVAISAAELQKPEIDISDLTLNK